MEGHRVRRRQGPARRAEIVDWYMESKINIDDLITHKLKLADINQGFDLDARRQIHPLGRCVLRVH